MLLLLLLLSTKAYRHQNDIEGEKLGWFLSSDCVRLKERRLEIKHFNRGKRRRNCTHPDYHFVADFMGKDYVDMAREDFFSSIE